MTTMSGPYPLSLPRVPPTPVEGCDACQRMDEERARAHAQGDYSAVSDWNVKMRAHQAKAP